MKYHLDWLLNKHKQDETIKYIFFWGHTPNKDGSMGKSCFSQWWPEGFEVDGKVYRSAEHWMMVGKARLFDEEMVESILAAKTPAEAKKLGRKVRNFDSATWGEHKYDIVKQGNIHKFGQHEGMRTFLLSTGNRVLVEASPYDRIWGIGMTQDHEHAKQPDRWRGENLLGFALMEVRDELSD